MKKERDGEDEDKEQKDDKTATEKTLKINTRQRRRQ